MRFRRLSPFAKAARVVVLIEVGILAAAQLEYRVDQVVKVVNDATDAAIAANRAGVLTDAYEKTILTINKQVLDVIAANPQGFRDRALAVIRNARHALPPALDAAIALYIQKTIDAILEVR